MPTAEPAAAWDGPADAAPRVGMWARAMADAAFEPHDIARSGCWDQGSAEDAVAAFEIHVQTLENLPCPGRVPDLPPVHTERPNGRMRVAASRGDRQAATHPHNGLRREVVHCPAGVHRSPA